MDCIYRHTDSLQKKKKKFRKQAHYRETSWESCLDSFVYKCGGILLLLSQGTRPCGPEDWRTDQEN